MLSLIYVKKFTSFCQVLKKMHTKENWFLSFCLTVYMPRVAAWQWDGQGLNQKPRDY